MQSNQTLEQEIEKLNFYRQNGRSALELLGCLENVHKKVRAMSGNSRTIVVNTYIPK